MMDVCSKPQFNKIDFICAKSLFDVAFYTTYITKLLYKKLQIIHDKNYCQDCLCALGGGKTAHSKGFSLSLKTFRRCA